MAKDWDYANLAHTAKEFGVTRKVPSDCKRSFFSGRQERTVNY